MAVELRPNVHWISESYNVHERPYPKRLHVSVYLVEHDGRYLLVDTGSFNDRETILAEIKDVVGDDGLDAFLLTHADLPHSGNVPALLEEFPDAELIGTTSRPELNGLPECRTVDVGATVDVLGRKVTLLDSPLADIQHTVWIYDHATEILFTADGLGNYHSPVDADATFGELRKGLSVEDVREFHRESLAWLRYVEPSVLVDRVHQLLDERPLTWIAPIHGTPVQSEYIAEYVELFERAVVQIANDYSDEDQLIRTRGRRIE